MSGYAKTRTIREEKALSRVCRKSTLIIALCQNYGLIVWLCKALKKRALVWLGCGIAVVCLLGLLSADAFALETCTVSGTVKFSGEARGVQGVTVTLRSQSPAYAFQGTTDSYGRYSVPVNKGVSGTIYYTVTPSSASCILYPKALTIALGDTRKTLDFILPPQPTSPPLATYDGAAGGVKISWSYAAPACPGESYKGFVVRRSTDPNFATDTVTLTEKATGSTYTDKTIPSGGTYYYRIRAVNTAGQSRNSPISTPGVTICALTGKVKYTDESAVSGVVLTAKEKDAPVNTRTGKTGTDGSFSILVPGGRTYVVTLTKDGRSAVVIQDTPVPGEYQIDQNTALDDIYIDVSTQIALQKMSYVAYPPSTAKGMDLNGDGKDDLLFLGNARPVTADIDRDGLPETVVPASLNGVSGLYCVRRGAVLWCNQSCRSTATPALGDIDGDYDLETVIVETDAAGLPIAIAAYNCRGGLESRYDIPYNDPALPAGIKGTAPTTPALRDIDNDYRAEIVATVGSRIFVFDDDLPPRAAVNFTDAASRRSYSVEAPYQADRYPECLSPVIADLGNPTEGDLYIAFFPTRDGAVRSMGIMHTEGAAPEGRRGVFGRYRFLDGPAAAPLAVAEMTGDGVPDIIAGTEAGSLYIISGGDRAVFAKCAVGSAIRTINTVDVDDDYVNEIIVGTDAGAGQYDLRSSSLWRIFGWLPEETTQAEATATIYIGATGWDLMQRHITGMQDYYQAIYGPGHNVWSKSYTSWSPEGRGNTYRYRYDLPPDPSLTTVMCFVSDTTPGCETSGWEDCITSSASDAATRDFKVCFDNSNGSVIAHQITFPVTLHWKAGWERRNQPGVTHITFGVSGGGGWFLNGKLLVWFSKVDVQQLGPDGQFHPCGEYPGRYDDPTNFIDRSLPNVVNGNNAGSGKFARRSPEGTIYGSSDVALETEAKTAFERPYR